MRSRACSLVSLLASSLVRQFVPSHQCPQPCSRHTSSRPERIFSSFDSLSNRLSEGDGASAAFANGRGATSSGSSANRTRIPWRDRIADSLSSHESKTEATRPAKGGRHLRARSTRARAEGRAAGDVERQILLRCQLEPGSTRAGCRRAGTLPALGAHERGTPFPPAAIGWATSASFWCRHGSRARASASCPIFGIHVDVGSSAHPRWRVRRIDAQPSSSMLGPAACRRQGRSFRPPGRSAASPQGARAWESSSRMVLE